MSARCLIALMSFGLLSCSSQQGELRCNDVVDIEYEWQVEVLAAFSEEIPLEGAWGSGDMEILTAFDGRAIEWTGLHGALWAYDGMGPFTWNERADYSPSLGAELCYLDQQVEVPAFEVISYSGMVGIEDGEMVMDPDFERIYEITLSAQGPIESGECAGTQIDVEFELRLTLDDSDIEPVRSECH